VVKTVSQVADESGAITRECANIAMPPSLRQDIISEQAFGLSLDNGLLVAEIAAGEPVKSTEFMSLAAGATALYVTVALESRTLGSVEKCRELWGQAAQMFDELCDSWTGIPEAEQSVEWLRDQLGHYRSLCQDRKSLYSVSEKERQVFAGQKGDSPPRPEQSVKELESKRDGSC
jgi:hypothetical protein